MLLQILSVSAIVLANLCVSYIMTSQNEEVSGNGKGSRHSLPDVCTFYINNHLFIAVSGTCTIACEIGVTKKFTENNEVVFIIMCCQNVQHILDYK